MTAVAAPVSEESPAGHTPEYNIRTFTPDDYEAILAIHNANFPEYKDTAAEWRFHDERREAKFRWQRYVAVAPDGRILAAGSYEQHPWMYHPQKFDVGVAVDPEWQGQGIGAALYRHILREMEPLNPISLRAHAREDMTRSVAFATQRGFAESMREWESRLNVAACDLAQFEGAAQRVRDQGIIIKTLRELEADPDRDRKLYEVDIAVALDMPSSDTPTSPEFDDWRKHTFENPNLLPDAYFVAIDTTAGDRYVGVSQLWKSQASDDLFTGATGVLREYRRRGIAQAMKLRAVAHAKQVGCETVRTWNAQSNRAMLSINEALGFVKQPAWIEYTCVIKEEESE